MTWPATPSAYRGEWQRDLDLDCLGPVQSYTFRLQNWVIMELPAEVGLELVLISSRSEMDLGL